MEDGREIKHSETLQPEWDYQTGKGEDRPPEGEDPGGHFLVLLPQPTHILIGSPQQPISSQLCSLLLSGLVHLEEGGWGRERDKRQHL